MALPQASLAYKPGRLDEWLAVNLADAAGAEWGAILFTLGVLVTVPVFVALAKLIAGPLRGLAILGTGLLVLGPLINGMATMLPFVVSTQLATAADMSGPAAQT